MTFPIPHAFWLFVVAAFVVLALPGPSVLYVVTRSMDQGRAAGIASALGTGAGNLVLAVCAAVGLTAILAASALVFRAVKYVGAAYLMCLGIRRLLGRMPVEAPMVQHQPLSRIFGQGALVELLNPKTVLFYLAFLPQFVDAPQAVWEQTLLLGLTCVCVGVVTDSLYALATGTAGEWLRRSRAFRVSQRYVAGSTYLLLGVVALFAGHASGSAARP